jgi:hypothetical protein
VSEDRYYLNCTMSKADAVRLIKALSDALLHESGRTDVEVTGWRVGESPRTFIEINDQPAGVLLDVDEL